MHINAFEQYLRYEKRLSSHTLTAYQSDLRQFVDFLQKTYEIDAVEDIDAMHIRSWMVQLISEGRSAATIARKAATLKSYFRFLLKQGHLFQNPMQKVMTPKLGKRLPVYLQEKEMAALFEKLAVAGTGEFWALRDRLMLALLYGAGLRRGELIYVKTVNIDLEGKALKVLGKGNKERLVPFGEMVKELVELYLDARQEAFPDVGYGELLLTDKGQPLYPKFVYNKVTKYLSMVTTLEKKSPHTLRHTFATHLSNNGAELNAIKELLGHSSLVATQVYTHNSIEQLKKVYQKAHPKAKE